MNRLKLGIDIDGVLAFFDAAYHRELNIIQGTNVPFYNAKSWHHETVQGGFTRDTVETFWNTIAKGESFWELLPPYHAKGSPEHVRLSDIVNKHDVYFITTRMQPPKVASENWLYWYLKVGEQRVYRDITVLISGDKGYVARGLGLDAIIDDKPQNLEHCFLYSPKTKRLLLTQSWNTDYDNPVIERVDTLLDGFDKMEKIGYNG